MRLLRCWVPWGARAHRLRGSTADLMRLAYPQTIGTSSITLSGALKHLALVEDDYFTRRLNGGNTGAPLEVLDCDADSDWEWHISADDSPD